jgi:hypothetical protein
VEKFHSRDGNVHFKKNYFVLTSTGDILIFNNLMVNVFDDMLRELAIKEVMGNGPNGDQNDVGYVNQSEDLQNCNPSDLHECVSENISKNALYDHAYHVSSENLVLRL